MLMVTDVQDIIKRHQAQIITSLKDPDIRLHLLAYILISLIMYIFSWNYVLNPACTNSVGNIIIHVCIISL